MKHVTRLRVCIAKQFVGELATDARGRIYFQYDGEWLETGFDLSPGTLSFNDKVQLSPEPELFGGLHGVFNDSIPDRWGLLLMDRALRESAQWQAHEITPLDRLAYMGSRLFNHVQLSWHWMFKSQKRHVVDALCAYTPYGNTGALMRVGGNRIVLYRGPCAAEQATTTEANAGAEHVGGISARRIHQKRSR